MPRAAGVRRRRLSLTPLIDVVFLLLLFFMLTSTFTRFSELPLSAAAAGAAATDARPVFVRLAPEALSVNGTPATLDELPAAVRALLPEGEGGVLVSLQGAVTAQRLTDLLVALRAVAGAQIRVLG